MTFNPPQHKIILLNKQPNDLSGWPRCNLSTSPPVLACCNASGVGVTLARQQVLQRSNFMVVGVPFFQLLAQFCTNGCDFLPANLRLAS